MKKYFILIFVILCTISCTDFKLRGSWIMTEAENDNGYMESVPNRDRFIITFWDGAKGKAKMTYGDGDDPEYWNYTVKNDVITLTASDGSVRQITIHSLTNKELVGSMGIPYRGSSRNMVLKKIK